MKLPFWCVTAGKHLTKPHVFSEQGTQNVSLPPCPAPKWASQLCTPDSCFHGLSHVVEPPGLSQDIPSPGRWMGGSPWPQNIHDVFGLPPPDTFDFTALHYCAPALLTTLLSSAPWKGWVCFCVRPFHTLLPLWKLTSLFLPHLFMWWPLNSSALQHRILSSCSTARIRTGHCLVFLVSYPFFKGIHHPCKLYSDLFPALSSIESESLFSLIVFPQGLKGK